MYLFQNLNYHRRHQIKRIVLRQHFDYYCFDFDYAQSPLGYFVGYVAVMAAIVKVSEDSGESKEKKESDFATLAWFCILGWPMIGCVLLAESLNDYCTKVKDDTNE